MPRELQRQVYKPQTNEKILNAIHKTASNEYQKRVPRANQADMRQTMMALDNNTPAWNEFLNSLMNQIGEVIYKNKVWSNPLAEFKGPMLQFGDTIEEVATALIKAYVYDPDYEYTERMIFGQHRPDSITSFHKINREKFYPVTINRAMLQRAFTSEYGLSDLISGLMDAPATSDQWDEFLEMANLLKLYEEAGGFFKENIQDVAAANSTETTVKSVLRLLRKYARLLPFISTMYNPAGVPSFANADDMILIATPEFLSAIDVEGLASLFNVSYAEVPYRVVPMPTQYMPRDVQAILTTKDFFVVRDTLFRTTSAENPVGLTENFFLHHHGIVSVSRFVPAIAFTTGAGTPVMAIDEPVTGLSALTVTDEDGAEVTELTRGRNHVVSALATTEGTNDAAAYWITGNEHTRTRVSQAGILFVSEEETASSIVVHWGAVDADPGTVENQETFTVKGGYYDAWPNPSYTPDDDTDGLPEVTPLNLSVSDGNKVLIPSVRGVQYKRAGTNVLNGSIQEITTETVFTAEARTNFELAADAVTSWTLSPDAE